MVSTDREWLHRGESRLCAAAGRMTPQRRKRPFGRAAKIAPASVQSRPFGGKDRNVRDNQIARETLKP